MSEDSHAIDSRIRDLFAAIDAMETQEFLKYLTPDASFKFGNWPAAVGHEAVGATVDNFFGSIKALSHRITNVLRADEYVACRGESTYTKLDGSQVVIPFANFFRMEGDLIKDYQIYADVTPLFS